MYNKQGWHAHGALFWDGRAHSCVFEGEGEMGVAKNVQTPTHTQWGGGGLPNMPPFSPTTLKWNCNGAHGVCLFFERKYQTVCPLWMHEWQSKNKLLRGPAGRQQHSVLKVSSAKHCGKECSAVLFFWACAPASWSRVARNCNGLYQQGSPGVSIGNFVGVLGYGTG